MKLAGEISRNTEDSSDISFFSHFYGALHILTKGKKNTPPWMFGGKQHDACEALMVMFT